MKISGLHAVVAFSVLYLLIGGIYFLQDFNLEFIIYIGVIVAIFGGVYATLRYTKFPEWMLFLLSLWGLMHVLGGAIETKDGVLFAYRIYPFIDLGGEFYVLKYDQFVHGYLYGLIAVMSHHVVRNVLLVKGHAILVFLLAALASIGISGLNEIMEFLISLNMQNGVGGYDNTMLDMCFNTAGAVIALGIYLYWKQKTDGPSVTVG